MTSDKSFANPLSTETLAVLIIGAGFSGLAMAIRCKKAGIAPYLVVEKGDDVGGTWHDNTYPGAACDIPSHLYSLSFVPKSDWSRLYPRQPEIEAYLHEAADKNGVRDNLSLCTKVEAARWDEAAKVWHVETSRGPVTARAIVSGMGALHYPATPKLPGAETFAGASFHSAQWDHAVDLKGKTIAVIGTGASTIQFLPQIAPDAAHLTLFQRTPPWVTPKMDRSMGEDEKTRFARWPLLRRLFRAKIFWTLEARAFLGFTKVSKLTEQAEKIARRHLKKAVKDEALRAKLMPTYRLGCKRVLISDDYYPALTRPNVEVETDGIARIEPDGIVTRKGAKHPCDVIIYGTGFDVTGSFAHLSLTGRGGQTLAQAWTKGMGAFQGISVSGFPNFFLLMGPNTGLGHNSMISMIEAQVNHALDCLKAMKDGKVKALEVKPEAQARFLDGIAEKMSDSIWIRGGCTSWYLDEHGRNTTLWPSSVVAYRKGAKRADLTDYQIS